VKKSDSARVTDIGLPGYFDRGRSETYELTVLRRVDMGRYEKDRNQKRDIMTHSDFPTRRSALTVFGAVVAMANLAVFASPAKAQSQSRQPEGTNTMNLKNQSAVNEVVRGGGLLVVSQWEAKDGQADKVAGILQRFLPKAQSDPGVKLFLIARGNENPAQFVFYELFVDEAALTAHLASDYFKRLIAGEALPLLSKREKAQYSLLSVREPALSGPG
jgi:quinol monooxygenase YgiN